MKIFDCSINNYSNRVHDINSLGPIENDIMSDLKKYSKIFSHEFVDDYKKSDLIITNTTYPDNILEWCRIHNIPKIKRMDGIFNTNENKHRNIPLNEAAIQSDMVIFISEYSRNMYNKLYGDKLKNECIILNNVDNTIFKYNNNIKNEFIICSSSTNWIRKDKRLCSIINLANRIKDNIYLIGKCDIDLPSNIIKIGYINDYNDMNNILNKCSLFLSLFFRCAGSKVTSQAIHTRLPVIYSSSGGIAELVNNNGEMISDYNTMDFVDSIPSLDDDEIYDKYLIIKNNYNYYINNFKKREDYLNTIESYFNILSLYN